MTTAPAKIKYTYEVATNTPTGIWRVADRNFADRRLTLAEKKLVFMGNGNIEVVALALSTLKIEGADITGDWLEDKLTQEELNLVWAYVTGGAAGVAAALVPVETPASNA